MLDETLAQTLGAALRRLLFGRDKPAPTICRARAGLDRELDSPWAPGSARAGKECFLIVFPVSSIQHHLPSSKWDTILINSSV